MERPEQLTVIVKSEPQQPLEDGGRASWLVSVQTLLSGAPAELETTTASCSLASAASAPAPPLLVTCLGQADCSTLVYSVQEPEEAEVGSSEAGLVVTVTPLYHYKVTSMYKLDPRLAEFVGRSSLVHPKYVLTMIHAYARTHKLYHQKTIKCDDVLYNIFEKDCLDLRSLWKEVCRLLRKFEAKTVSTSHKLSDSANCSSSTLDITVDTDLNLFPENWKFDINKTKTVSRTQSFCPAVKVVDKRKSSFKRNKSFEL